MRIAICEDTAADRARLAGLLAEYLAANGLEAEVETFDSGEALLAVFTPGRYHILFLDIYMDAGGITGMAAAETVRQADGEAGIIFTTKSVEHGPASYAVDAAYYLVKPVEKAGLGKALDKCRARLDRYAKTIEVMENRQTVRLRLRDIVYAEVIRHNTLIHANAGEIKIHMPFGEFCDMLGGFPFVQCHRSYVVNMIHVQDMGTHCFTMRSGQVPISKTYQEQARKSFRIYFWEELGC